MDVVPAPGHDYTQFVGLDSAYNRTLKIFYSLVSIRQRSKKLAAMFSPNCRFKQFKIYILTDLAFSSHFTHYSYHKNDPLKRSTIYSFM